MQSRVAFDLHATVFAPDTDEYWERCAQGYADVKFVNQVLGGKDVKPKSECLGTPKFITRSIASGSLLDEDEYESSNVRMPPMEGSLRGNRQFMHTTDYHHENSGSPTQSDIKLAHQLFHDAESTFWVIAWLLARSAREGSDTESKPNSRYKDFFHTMYKHYPKPEYDNRSLLCERSDAYWTSVLHPDLVTLAPMLNNMHRYIRPEWAYRPELNPEHVHEALMRLLLAEIIRIDEAGADITIALGGRPVPPPPEDTSPL